MHKITALYKFCDIEDPVQLQRKLKKELKNLQILGTIIIGREGINGTLSGTKLNLNKAIKFLKSDSRFSMLDTKESFSRKAPFLRLKVKIKDEIVAMGIGGISPSSQSGEYVGHKKWNSLIKDKNTILIDTRNDYEYSIGTFKNSINPQTSNFKEFPKWVTKQKFSKFDKIQKNVAMFCTGGIRCEKASSFMKNQGFKNVYHLKGGILKYFELISEEQSKWEGECFVFDDRVSVKQDLSEGTYDMCHGCRMPITEKDKTSKKYIKGVSCSKCFDKTTEEQKSRYMSRQKQIDLAKKRNQRHIGPKEEVFN